MAKTKASVRGKQQKKIVPVRGHTRKVGSGGSKRVKTYRRSTPN